MTMRRPTINIIAAVCNNMAIGRNGDLLFHISADLKRFKILTMGHPIIMGRKTFESLPKGALPGRRNIVITRNPSCTAPGAETVASLDEAVELCAGSEHIFIIGGAQIYRLACPMADRLLLTRIAASPDDADCFFPQINPTEWLCVSEGDLTVDGRTGVEYRFETLTRACRQ